MVHHIKESFFDASDKTQLHVPCPCRACQKHREYAKIHPEKHNANMRAYYYRHHDEILLRKAYQRFMNGRTKKLHKSTTRRLIDAGFDVRQMTSPSDTESEIEASALPLGSFTSIEVS